MSGNPSGGTNSGTPCGCSGGLTTGATNSGTPCGCCGGLNTNAKNSGTPCPCDCAHQGTIPVRCCPIGSNSPNCCLDPSGCDQIYLPATMTCSLSNQSFCACVSGSFTVTWNATDQAWEGSGNLGSCGHTYQVKLYCNAPTGGACATPCAFYMDDQFDGNPVSPPACANARTCWLGTFVCGPPFMISFRVSGPGPCGCTGGSNSFNVVFTA